MRFHSSPRSIVCALPLALPLLACGSKAPQASASHAATTLQITDGEGEASFSLAIENGRTRMMVTGRTLDIEAGVTLDYSFSNGSVARASRPGGHDDLDPSPVDVWLGLQPVSFADDVLHIGATEYGAAPTGCTITVNAEGISIDGEHRGVLP